MSDNSDTIASSNGSPERKDNAEEESRRVVLERGQSGFGLKITSIEDEAGVRIDEVTPGGVADMTGKVFKNDVILEVNGTDMTNAKHDDVVNALRASPTVTLVLARSVPVGSSPSKLADQPSSIDLSTTSIRPPPTYGAAVSTPSRPNLLEDTPTPAAASSANAAANSATAPLPTGASSTSVASSSQPQSSPLSNKRLLKMSRRSNGFGMKIRSDPGIRGVRVSDISKGGAADTAGNVFVGDYILEINGVPMLHASHDDVVSALLKSTDVSLLLGTEHDANVYASESLGAQQGLLINERTVHLRRQGNTGLGMKIKADDVTKGVRVVEITPGGAAERSGEVSVGDIIISINNVSMIDAQQSDITEAISAGRDECIIVIAQEDRRDAKAKRSFVQRLSTRLFGAKQSSRSGGGSDNIAIPEEALQALQELANSSSMPVSRSTTTAQDTSDQSAKDAQVAKQQAKIRSLEEEVARQRDRNDKLIKAQQDIAASKTSDSVESQLRQELTVLRMKLIELEISRVNERGQVTDEVVQLREDVTKLVEENEQLRVEVGKLKGIQMLIRSIQEANSNPHEETTETSA